MHKVQGQALSQRDEVAQNAAEQGYACCNLLNMGVARRTGAVGASSTAPRALRLRLLASCRTHASYDALPHQDLSRRNELVTFL